MTVDRLLYDYVVSETEYSNKSIIMKEGAHGQTAYLILEGNAKVFKKIKKGAVTITTLKEGDIFGEMVLFAEKGKGVRAASVVAEGPVRVGRLDSTRILSDYQKVSPQLRDLIRTLSKRLDEMNEKAVSLVVKLKK